MTLVTVERTEQKQSARGGFTRAALKGADGRTVWASCFKQDLAPLLIQGAQLDVELGTSGDKGQFTDILAAAPAPAGAMLPGIAPLAAVGAPGAPVAAPQASDPTTARIYRCTALQAAVGMWGPVAGRFSPESLRDEEGGLETLITMNRAVLQSADLFYAWLQGQAPQPGPGEKQEGEPF